MDLELVLDERAAEGKAALANGAVEGQRGGGALLAVHAEHFSVSKRSATFANMRQQRNLEKKYDETRGVLLTETSSPQPRAPSTSGEPAPRWR